MVIAGISGGTRKTKYDMICFTIRFMHLRRHPLCFVVFLLMRLADIEFGFILKLFLRFPLGLVTQVLKEERNSFFS